MSDTSEKKTDITGVILAGGRGERLKSALPHTPKVLAPVNGKPYLTYVFERLIQTGIRKAILCTGYHADQVRSCLGESYGPLELVYSEETKPLGTAGALSHALPLIDSGDVLVMNGDSFFTGSLLDFIAWSRKKAAIFSLILCHIEDTRRFGRVAKDDDGRIIRFYEKSPEAVPGWINAGTYCIQTELLGTISRGECVSLEHEIIPSLIPKGIFGYPGTGRFIDIGTPSSYARANNFFKDNRYGH